MSAAAPPYKLFPHQEVAVDNIVAALQTDDRTQAIMACGTGKTFTGQRAAERITKDNPDALTLVTVPNMVLVDQLMREWIAQVSPGFDFQAQPVVSEAASAATRAAAAKRDEITGFELHNNTTDSKPLAAFMLASGRRIIFSTYQSSGRIAEAVSIAKKSRPGFAIDLIVADEAHRTAGPGAKAEAGLFKTILDDTKIDAAKRLFMTATPRQSRVVKGEVDLADFSMGNQNVYGKRAVTLSLKWAVKNGHLAPYRAFVAQVSDADVAELLEKNENLRVTGSETVVSAAATQIAAAIILVKAAKQRNLGSIVTYHNSIQGAEDFKIILTHVVAAMPADSKPAGKLSVEHINGETPAVDRAAYLATLDATNREPGDWSVVTNCNCLTEGVNVPSMDAIMLVDPRSSNVSIVQAVGRPMRKDKNRPKKVASILLPVFVGKFDSTDEVIESGAFSSVYLALQALKDHDEALSEMFINELAGREPSEARGPKATDQRQTVVEPLPDEDPQPDLSDDEQGDSADPADTVPDNSYPMIRIADHNGESLQGQANDAVVTIMAPKSHGDANSKTIAHHLDWHNTLSLTVLKDNATTLERALAALCARVSEHGNVMARAITTLYVSPDGFKLGEWVARRRSEYRTGKLSLELIAELESLHGWSWMSPRTEDVRAMRQRRLAALRAYVSEYGHVRVPREYVSPDGFELGESVKICCDSYGYGLLSKDVIPDLESLPGWSWRWPAEELKAKQQMELEELEAKRQNDLAALRDYVSEHGQAKVPKDYVSPDGFALGTWVSKRREEYRAGKLPPALFSELESLTGHFGSLFEADNQAALAALRTFAAERGHSRIPVVYRSTDGIALGTWVSNCRDEYSSGKLSVDFIAELESIPNWSWMGRKTHTRSGAKYAKGV